MYGEVGESSLPRGELMSSRGKVILSGEEAILRRGYEAILLRGDTILTLRFHFEDGEFCLPREWFFGVTALMRDRLYI